MGPAKSAQAAAPPAPPKKPAQIGTIPGLVIVVLCLVGLAHCMGGFRLQSPPQAAGSPATLPPPPAAAPSQKAAAPAPPKWVYRTETDDMSGKPNKHATVQSFNSFELAFPYGRPQRATLHVRNHSRHGNDAIISIQRGQLMCTLNDCSLSVRFDDSDPVQFRMTESASSNSEILFFEAAPDFVRRLGAAKQVRVELKFFQNAPKVVAFHVEGFDANRLK
jgi:hypothetical protein